MLNERSHSIRSIIGHAVKKVVTAWQARKTMHTMLEYEDYLLEDIGLTRDEIRLALARPYTRASAQDLIKTAQNRRREWQDKALRNQPSHDAPHLAPSAEYLQDISVRAA